jgi:hypothetical protein
MKVAADGEHYRIAFDKPNTWSQKYNLVWDVLLGLDIFPAEVGRKEVAYYKTRLERFGVPLDSRTRLTKTDWSLWIATLAEDPADFEAIVSPIHDYLNQTTARLPFVDSYMTDNAQSDGMRARPVIGGVFIKMLADPANWQKWSSRDQARVGNWAAAPSPPRVTEVVPTSEHKPVVWRYSFAKPSADWARPEFDDGKWKLGRGGFGTSGTPGVVIGTTWDTSDIWLRREVVLPDGTNPSNIQLRVYHDEDIEVYIDGVLAASQSGYLTAYDHVEIGATTLKRLEPGKKFVIAVHCHQTGGGQGVDVGLVDVVETSR